MIIAVNFPIGKKKPEKKNLELNKLTSLPMCGFIAQLVEQRTSNAEVTGSSPDIYIYFFSGFFFPIA